MKRTTWLEIGTLVFFSILLVFPVIVLARGLSLRADTDYDMQLPMMRFAELAYRQPAPYVHTNPYISTGIPVLGDPTSYVFNPLVVFPVLWFGVEDGMRAIFLATVMLSAFSMWWLLKKYIPYAFVRIWGAALYASSGTIAAMFAAGHGVKFLPFILMPLFLRSALTDAASLPASVNCGLILGMSLLSGDIYTTWFMVLFYVSIKSYYWMTGSRREHIVLGAEIAFAVFALLVSPKIYFYLRDVAPIFARFYAAKGAEGSIHAPFIALPFVVPFQVTFYDRPFFQRLLGFHFNWYEYYAFISPLPFLFLAYIKHMWKKHVTKILILLIALGALYVSMGHAYSPFYWLFRLVPPLQVLRVPQRIVLPLTSVVVLLCSLGASAWFGSGRRMGLFIGICVVSVVWTGMVFQQTLRRTFEPIRQTETHIVGALREADPSSFFVGNFVCCTQWLLVQARIPIYNFYYGWLPKGIPRFHGADDAGVSYEALATHRPKYVIVPSSVSLWKYNYEPFIEYNTIRVWSTDTVTVRPAL